MDTPLLRTTITDTTTVTRAYHADGLGSIVGVSDASGALVATARYDAWGTTITTTGTVPRYGYTGREPDATGLVYYRARYYDPTIGRFTQRDPIGLTGGINPYLYADGNPVNGTDPTGLSASPLAISQGTASPSPLDAATGATSAFPNLQAVGLGTSGSGGSTLPEAMALARTGGLNAPFEEATIETALRAISPEWDAITPTTSTETDPEVLLVAGWRRGDIGCQDCLMAPEGGGAGGGAARGLGNPFSGKAPQQVDEMFRAKGFEPRGPDPASGKGGYINPQTGRSYHLDPSNRFGEPPHVDVNRDPTWPNQYLGPLEKRKYFFGE